PIKVNNGSSESKLNCEHNNFLLVLLPDVKSATEKFSIIGSVAGFQTSVSIPFKIPTLFERSARSKLSSPFAARLSSSRYDGDTVVIRHAHLIADANGLTMPSHSSRFMRARSNL